MLYLSSDVGGTFVDLVLIDTATGQIMIDKTASTGRSAEGILEGLARLCRRAGLDLEAVAGFVHGFTIATNAWLERRGAKVALLVTRGFRDLLEVGTQQRSDLYALIQHKPAPLVPRSCIVEVDERIDAFGDVVMPLDADAMARVVGEVSRLRPDAVAVALIFGHINPCHERSLWRAMRSAMPGLPIYLSSDVNTQIGEYPRTNTTAAAAYVGPPVDHYLAELEAGLREVGLLAPLRLMRSDGGVSTSDAARLNPTNMLLSGPAGGVIAAAELGRLIGADDVISFDMGGTSADFSLIEGGRPRLSREQEIDGQVLRLEMLDIATISAGGGSIAMVDIAGGLHIGPRSAGSYPGPASYGQGGDEPTLTDAALVLGLIDADNFAGGGLKLDVKAAAAAIERQVGRPLGVSVLEAAIGMIEVANARMRQAIRALTIERGHDIRKFSLVAFGGAGPLFAAMMEPQLNVREVLIPPQPGVFAAYGLLLADITHRSQRPYAMHLEELDSRELHARLKALQGELDSALARDAVPSERRSYSYFCDMRYVGQFHNITVPLSAIESTAFYSPAALAGTFHEMHAQAFGHADETSPVEIVAIRCEARGKVDKPTFVPLLERSSGRVQPRGTRKILLNRSSSPVSCDIYAREDLLAGDAIRGPAIINQADTTVLLLPSQAGRVDGYGVLHIGS